MLQVPIRIELREKAEKEAKDMGFSSLQEMVRVMLAQMVKKEIEPEFKIDDLCDKYGINYLGMFGSVARGEARKGSDIDLLVRFKRKNKVGLFGLYDLEKDLERKFGRKVDLVTKLNKHVEPYVMKDLKTLYEKK